jgi:SAM-dependent methyltransferase
MSNAWPEERQRLAALEEIYDPATIRHLEAIGVAEGWHCLELGGGGGSIARWMSRQVGPSGRVLVTDLDPRFLGDVGPNVEVRVHDIRTEELDEEFDLIHARALLEHLPERAEVLKKIVAALRPGGWLLLEDADFTGWFCLPAARIFASPRSERSSWKRFLLGLRAHMTSGGFDGEFARELPSHLVDAGLVDVDAEGFSRLLPAATSRAAFNRLSCMQLGQPMLEEGLTTKADLGRVVGLSERPGSAIMGLPMVSAWGRRPD